MSAVLVATVVFLQRWIQTPREDAASLLAWCGWACGAALLLWILLRRVRERDRILRGYDTTSWRAYFLAAQAGILGLFVPASLYVWRTRYEEIDWGGEFLNKRWLLALYWLAVATCLVFPHL